jgi:hypothetical protein
MLAILHLLVMFGVGTAMVARLLDFAQTSRDHFKASDVGYGESNRVDLARRRSSKLKQLGELENELRVGPARRCYGGRLDPPRAVAGIGMAS